MRSFGNRLGAPHGRAALCVAVLTTLALAGGGGRAPELRNGDYTPPAASRPLLGTIPLDRATLIAERFAGGKRIFRLPGGQIYIDADMDIDADGSPRARTIDPCAGCGQPSTSFIFPGITSGQRRFANSETVNYVALPGNNPRAADRFFRRMGLQLGDVVVVVFRDRIEYAIFADVGPRDKIGEGSIALSQSLGNDPFITRRDGRRIIGRGIPADVIYIAFPGSTPAGLTPENVLEKTRAAGRALFAGIGGNPAP